MVFKDTENHAFYSDNDLWCSVWRISKEKIDKKKFTYIYWGALDTLSHRSGPQHALVHEEWSTFTHSLFQFLFTAASSNNTKTLFLLTADHGQVPTEILPKYDLKTHINLLDHFIMNPTGESRLPFLYIKHGREENVAKYLSSHWDQQFNMVSSAEFLESGLMGSGKAYKGTLDRIGNHVIIPDNDAYWWWINKDNVLHGRHGGLSPQEMLVPLFALEL